MTTEKIGDISAADPAALIRALAEDSARICYILTNLPTNERVMHEVDAGLIARIVHQLTAMQIMVNQDVRHYETVQKLLLDGVKSRQWAEIVEL